MAQTLFIVVTERCNRQCSFCFNLQGEGQLRDQFLDPDLLKQIIETNREMNQIGKEPGTGETV